ncbi:hypothetical protein BTN50_0547 [Candidatus Enterovibrio altilux]|uniref:Uncharacterized protein n=1 Tax=Candidatus Enterovibrio altilux TaxID=1927128 RepID=A0A291B7V0_9GAMM|nr:hypothetical protein BTN50_0547 [Candidatus Enterovibrio luxaltus]
MPSLIEKAYGNYTSFFNIDLNRIIADNWLLNYTDNFVSNKLLFLKKMNGTVPLIQIIS